MLKKSLKYILSLGIGVAFLWYTFRQIDMDSVLTAMESVSWLYLALAGCISLISHVARSLRWRILISPLKEPLQLGAVFAAVMIGYAVNLVLPRGGEVARVVSLNREENTPISGVLATVVVERILDALALAILLSFSLYLFSSVLSDAYPGLDVIGLILLGGCMTVLAGLIMASVYRTPVLTFLNNQISRVSSNVALKVTTLLDTFLQGIAALHSAHQVGGVVLWSVVTWGLYIAAMWLILVAFDFTSIYHIGLTGSILVLAMTGIGVSIPIPGAVGTYHFLCVQTLVLAFALPQSDAAAFATISHALNFIVLNGIGGICCWILQQFGMLRGAVARNSIPTSNA